MADSEPITTALYKFLDKFEEDFMKTWKPQFIKAMKETFSKSEPQSVKNEDQADASVNFDEEETNPCIGDGDLIGDKAGDPNWTEPRGDLTVSKVRDLEALTGDEYGDVILGCVDEANYEAQLQIEHPDADSMVSDEEDHEDLLAELEDPSPPIHLICIPLIPDKVTSLPYVDYSSPSLSAIAAIETLCKKKKECNTANKVFDKMPERDGYIPTLNPKPPDDHNTQSWADKIHGLIVSVEGPYHVPILHELVGVASLSIWPMGEHEGAIKPCWTRPSRNGWEESKGFLIFSLTGGPEYHVLQVANAVLVARRLGAKTVLLDIIGNKPSVQRKSVDEIKDYGITLQNFVSISEQQIGGIIQVGARGTGKHPYHSYAIVVVGKHPYGEIFGDNTNLPIPAPGLNTIKNVYGTEKCIAVIDSHKDKVLCVDWWIEDLSVLQIDLYQRVMTAMKCPEEQACADVNSSCYFKYFPP